MRIPLRLSFRSFFFLNVTQFLGALNDNIFKLLVIYLLINLQGEDKAPLILSLAGAFFVVPFLLLSSAAGILADRISKQKILASMKVAELCIMTLSLIIIYFQWGLGLYTFLFLMAAQSAIFGPSKYGIIPEIVEPKDVSKANGTLSAFTYLAIIFGTFLASFLTDISHKNFLLVTTACIVLALAGLFASLQIEKTSPKGSKKKINLLFFREIYKTLKLSRQTPQLLPAIFGSAFFLFMGGYVQLNIIPFAIQSLHLTEVEGGYLFLTTAVGIALGSWLAGKISKNQPQPGMSCLSGYILAFFFFLLSIFAWNLWTVIILLVLLGMTGGGFLIPLDSYIQIKSPDKYRGQIIAAANFLSFCGVLCASFVLYLISELSKFTAASGFSIVGILTLFFSIILTARMANFFFPFFAKKILKRFYVWNIETLPSSSTLLLMKKEKWLFSLLLFGSIPSLRIITTKKKWFHFPFLNNFFNNIEIAKNESITEILLSAKEKKDEETRICLLLEELPSIAELQETIQKTETFSDFKIISISQKLILKFILGIGIPRKEFVFSFSST